MYRYTRADFDRVLEFVRRLYEPRTAEGLRDHLLPAMRALVPSAFAAEASYEVGAPQQGQTQRSDPPELRSAEADAALARHMPTSPIVVHFERTRCQEFTRWSDVQPLSQFLRTALYNEVYLPLGIKDGCSLFLRSGPNHLEFAGVGLHKQYADAHRDMLASVSPHVLQAFRLAHTTSALIEMAAMKSGANCADRGFMAVDLNGTITMETAAATRALEKFFPNRTEHGLPEQLARWISQSEQAMRKATANVGVFLGHVFDAQVGELIGKGFTLMSLPDTPERARLLQALPVFEPSAIPPDAFPGLPAISNLAQPVVWAAAPNLDARLAENMVTALSEPHNENRVSKLVDSARPVPEGVAFSHLPVPLSEGARRFALSKHMPIDVVNCLSTAGQMVGAKQP